MSRRLYVWYWIAALASAGIALWKGNAMALSWISAAMCFAIAHRGCAEVVCDQPCCRPTDDEVSVTDQVTTLTTRSSQRSASTHGATTWIGTATTRGTASVEP